MSTYIPINSSRLRANSVGELEAPQNLPDKGIHG